MAEVRRGGNWDALRLLGALAVLLSHQYWLAGYGQPRIGPMTVGTVGLLVFFSASGYLVAGSWREDPHLLRFALRRFLRIWPALAVCVSITAALVLWLHPSTFAHVAAWEYWDRNLLLQGFDWRFFDNRDPRLNAPLWTLRYEAGCYAAFALAVVVVPRSWWAAGTGLGVAAFAAGTWGWPAFDPSEHSTGYAVALLGGMFAIGAALRLAGRRRRRALLAACGVAGGLSMALGSGLLGLVLAVPALVVFIGMQVWPGLRSAARFGDLSYGLYLWGWPVQQAVVMLLGKDTALPILLVTSVAVTGVMAWLSWHLVEKQALRLKPVAPVQAHGASVVPMSQA